MTPNFHTPRTQWTCVSSLMKLDVYISDQKSQFQHGLYERIISHPLIGQLLPDQCENNLLPRR